jgi:hypothetical protein
MKKFLSILLISIYSMATFGMSVKQMYCCGNLKSISIAINIADKEKNEKQTKNDGCCKTTCHSFKVKDKHIASGTITFNAKPFVPVFAFSPVFNFNIPSHPFVDTSNEIHGPPLLHGNTPMYIFNCVFRI